MKKIIALSSALLFATAMIATPVFAKDKDKDHKQNHGHAGQNDQGWHDQGHNDRGDDHGYGHDNRGGNGNGRFEDHYHAKKHYKARVVYVQPRGYHPGRWNVGNRLPPGYYVRDYYVDYRAYRLPPPPYGYRWVRVDRDVYLVSTRSGLVRDLLIDLFY